MLNKIVSTHIPVYCFNIGEICDLMAGQWAFERRIEPLTNARLSCMANRTLLNLPPRLQSKIAPCPMSGCWFWTAAQFAHGYGKTSKKDKTVRAHNVVYELIKGPIPPGLVLDHLCRVRSCVNPDHLEPVTETENIRRGVSFSAINFRKTHCPQGHPYSPENTYRRKRRKHSIRVCKACTTIRSKKRWALKKEAILKAIEWGESMKLTEKELTVLKDALEFYLETAPAFRICDIHTELNNKMELGGINSINVPYYRNPDGN